MAEENTNKKKRHKKYRVIEIICISVAIITLALLSMASYAIIVDSQGIRTHFFTDKENLDKVIVNLTNEITELQYEKQSILKEINDLTYNKNELEKYYKELAKSKTIDKYVPQGAGAPKTYMGYSQKWISSSLQYKLHNDVSSQVWYDEFGYARLGDRYFVAVKPYYGKVGDYIEVYHGDGPMIPCIIGDNKGFENADIYIHHDGSIIEFMVQSTSTFSSVMKTRPEFCQPITAIKNIGNYYDE